MGQFSALGVSALAVAAALPAQARDEQDRKPRRPRDSTITVCRRAFLPMSIRTRAGHRHRDRRASASPMSWPPTSRTSSASSRASACRARPPASAQRLAPGRAGNEGFAIRGIGGNRVLIQVDGVRVPDGFTFGAQAAGARRLCRSRLVKSVEILRGPASALYGSDGLVRRGQLRHQ